MLEAVQATVAARRTILIRDVNIRLQPGRLTCVLGPNGAGKSTLLSALAGIRRLSGGEIRLMGRRMESWSGVELARQRAVLAQRVSLDFGFTVSEVVMLGRSPHVGRSSAARDREVVHEAMARTGVLHLARRQYPTLSGGEQQRVHLARVLAQLLGDTSTFAERYLLLDEPIASLDPGHQLTIMDLAREIADAGGAVLAVLHDLSLAAAYADEVVLMKDGQAIASGEPAAVLTATALEHVFGVRPAILPHLEGSGPLIAFTRPRPEAPPVKG